jgi:signal transduction histidine kinase
VGLRAWVSAMLLGIAPVVPVVAAPLLGLVPILGQLQESDRLERGLLATVSHELKTPLTVILGTLGTLSRRGAPGGGRPAGSAWASTSPASWPTPRAGELLLTDPVPPGPGARFELRLPLAELDQPGSLAYAASRR